MRKRKREKRRKEETIASNTCLKRIELRPYDKFLFSVIAMRRDVIRETNIE